MSQPENQPGESLTAEEWEARCERIAMEASTANPPRRFAICDDDPDPDEDDGTILAYGLAHGDRALVWRGSGSGVIHTTSPERALSIYFRTTDARLVWLD